MSKLVEWLCKRGIVSSGERGKRLEELHFPLCAAKGVGGGVRMLPIKVEVCSAIGKEAGQAVRVVLEERIAIEIIFM